MTTTAPPTKRLEGFADSVVKATQSYVARNLSPLIARVKAIEDRSLDLRADFASWALDFERSANEQLQRAYDRMPKPKNGEPGRDGLSIEDFNAVLKNDGRTLTLSLRNDHAVHVKNIKLSVLIDRGVFKVGSAYEAGDVVTYGGSLWIAKRDNKDSPGSASGPWRLAVKHGRDGKDAA